MNPPGPVRYYEPGRTYLSTAVLFAALAAGFALDVVAGQGVHHIVGWLIAAVLIVGSEALTVYAARVMRTITITDEEVRVGEEALARAELTSVSASGDADDHVLGRRYATGLPRGTQGVWLQRADGSHVILATRRPARVLTTLGAEAEEPAEIRAAEAEEFALLEEIDDRSESLYRVAGLELPQFDRSPEHPAVRRVLVVGRPPVGFVELCEVDGDGYVAELAVLPGHMRRGHGTALVNAACDWAREQGYPGLALTTFADVSWNGPFYQRLGFVEVTDPSPGLARIRAFEAEVGLDDVGRRIVMRRALGDV